MTASPANELNYLALDRSTDAGWRQQLQAGGGVKFPTGYYNRRIDHPTLQTGTGSWDALLNAIYTLRYNRFGLNTDAMFRLSGENASGYKAGNRFSGGLRFFYWKDWKNLTLLPNAGIVYETAGKDSDHGARLDLTGGQCTLAALGTDVYWKNWSVGLTWKAPLAQDLAEGRVQARDRWVLNLSRNF